jgi:hypothetical protein
MGVGGINGQDFTVLASSSAARTPGLGTRAPEPPTDVVVTPRAGPKTDERAVRQSEPDPRTLNGGSRMHVDKASKRIVVQIMDQNNEVIKQIPPEDLLKISARFGEFIGKMFDQKA